MPMSKEQECLHTLIHAITDIKAIKLEQAKLRKREIRLLRAAQIALDKLGINGTLYKSLTKNNRS